MDTDPYILNIDNVNRFAHWHKGAKSKYPSLTLFMPYNCWCVAIHIIRGLTGQEGMKMTMGICFLQSQRVCINNLGCWQGCLECFMKSFGPQITALHLSHHSGRAAGLSRRRERRVAGRNPACLSPAPGKQCVPPPRGLKRWGARGMAAKPWGLQQNVFNHRIGFCLTFLGQL